MSGFADSFSGPSLLDASPRLKSHLDLLQPWNSSQLGWLSRTLRRWQYAHEPEEGSPEAEIMEAFGSFLVTRWGGRACLSEMHDPFLGSDPVSRGTEWEPEAPIDVSTSAPCWKLGFWTRSCAHWR